MAGQERGEGIFCIVDLHADQALRAAGTARGAVRPAAILLAAGLDPPRSVLFRQSDVPAHTELTWLLANVTSYGELSRMTQFKDKAGRPASSPRPGCSSTRC